MAKDFTEEQKQANYRDARITGKYDNIWQTVGKCCFCEMNDKYVFHEENGVVMTVPLYAYIDGHILIVPRRHVRSVKDLTTEEWETIRKFMYLAKKIIREVHGIKSVQYVQKDGVTSQATVPDHIHFQVIPFDEPDLSVWNYRKLKHTPAENSNLYKNKHDKLQKLSKRFSDKYE
ncbi:HIT domain-containing protein [Candidatus Saccharibacteria bacterium]|nr:HIT domain-containing protein [Candidatus Saccharibacteria bacterium]